MGAPRIKNQVFKTPFHGTGLSAISFFVTFCTVLRNDLMIQKKDAAAIPRATKAIFETKSISISSPDIFEAAICFHQKKMFLKPQIVP